MRKAYVAGTFVLAAIGLFGCSHIPDPSDIPGVEPYYILQSIRCEIRRAVEREHSDNAHLTNSSIAYGLTLTAKEGSTKSAAIDVVRLISRGTLSLGVDAGTERERKNEIITNIAEQVQNTGNAPCDGDEERKSWKYPITGTLGIGEVIRRYVEISRIGPVSPEGFKQTMTFILRVNAGLNPGWSIVKDVRTQVAGDVVLKADREDRHELVISMAAEQGPSPPIKVHITNLRDLIAVSTRARPEAAVPADGERDLLKHRPISGPPIRSFSTPTQLRLLDSIERVQQRQRFREDIQRELR